SPWMLACTLSLLSLTSFTMRFASGPDTPLRTVTSCFTLSPPIFWISPKWRKRTSILRLAHFESRTSRTWEALKSSSAKIVRRLPPSSILASEPLKSKRFEISLFDWSTAFRSSTVSAWQTTSNEGMGLSLSWGPVRGRRSGGPEGRYGAPLSGDPFCGLIVRGSAAGKLLWHSSHCDATRPHGNERRLAQAGCAGGRQDRGQGRGQVGGQDHRQGAVRLAERLSSRAPTDGGLPGQRASHRRPDPVLRPARDPARRSRRRRHPAAAPCDQ